MKFGILGYGHLGKAVAGALVRTGDVKASDIGVCDSSEDALSHAEGEHFSTYTPEQLSRFIADSDVVCLVIKAHVFNQIVSGIDLDALREKFVISFMAEMTLSELIAALGTENIARAMPSLAIAKGNGVIAYTALPEHIAAIFGKFGFAFEIEESDMAKVTVLASSGMGFAAWLIDAYVKAGEELGFPQDTAAHMAELTFRSACDMGDFAQTVRAVATPGGITEQGINHMKNSGADKIIAEAMQKSLDKMNG